jgi:hypothetical protein
MDYSFLDTFLTPLAFIFFFPLAFFPFVILLDYHKKENIHRSIIYVVLFYSYLYLFIPIFLALAIHGLYILLFVPIFLFELAFRKKESSPITP